MTESEKNLRTKYDGKGFNYGCFLETVNKNDVCVLIHYIEPDEQPISMIQIFPDYINTLAFIGYGLISCEYCQYYLEDYFIDSSEELTFFTEDSDSKENYKDCRINWNAEDIKKWISEVNILLTSKNEFDCIDVNKFAGKFNLGASCYQIKATGRLHEFLNSDYIRQEFESYQLSNKNIKNTNHPFSHIIPLIENNCLDLDNEKHLEIVTMTLTCFYD